MKYKVTNIEIKDDTIELPPDAIPLKVTLMMTKPMSDPDTKMVNGISCLVPVLEESE